MGGAGRADWLFLQVKADFMESYEKLVADLSGRDRVAFLKRALGAK